MSEAGKLKISRLLGSLGTAVLSLVLLYSAVGLNEVAYDQLEGKTLPAFAQILQFFDPIGLMLIIVPLLLGIAHWRCAEDRLLNFERILKCSLTLGFVVAFFTAVLMATTFYTYMNGTHPITPVQIFGNVAMSLFAICAIIGSYRKQD